MTGEAPRTGVALAAAAKKQPSREPFVSSHPRMATPDRHDSQPVSANAPLCATFLGSAWTTTRVDITSIPANSHLKGLDIHLALLYCPAIRRFAGPGRSFSLSEYIITVCASLACSLVC
jgi:hypothetical protein